MQILTNLYVLSFLNQSSSLPLHKQTNTRTFEFHRWTFKRTRSSLSKKKEHIYTHKLISTCIRSVLETWRASHQIWVSQIRHTGTHTSLFSLFDFRPRTRRNIHVHRNLTGEGDRRVTGEDKDTGNQVIAGHNGLWERNQQIKWYIEYKRKKKWPNENKQNKWLPS